MVETARAAKAAPLRRDAVLEAVAFAAERLLLSSDWNEVAVEVLGRLGVAADVSRVHLVRNDDTDGRLTMRLAAEWCAPGTRSYRGDPVVDGLVWEPDHTRWVERMRAGKSIIGAIETFPEQERPALRSQSIVSLAYFPITVDGIWWGCIGFDDCEGVRDWSVTDLEGLRTAAALLGAAIARRRQEERLLSAESRYRSVVERIPAVTYVDVMEPTGARMAFISPQIEALLGYPYERYLADADFWFDLVHPDDRARMEAAASTAGRQGLAFDEEYRMHHVDGHWVWVHDTSSTVLRDDGSVAFFQGFMFDVTQRKEAEKQVRVAEERYRAIVENTPAITYQEMPQPKGFDQATSIAYVSPQIEQVLGYPAARWAQPGFWTQAVHPDDLAAVLAESHRTADSGEPYLQEYRMVAADGRVVWFHDESHLIRDT